MTGRSRILVIKLGALGDVVQALGPMAAIRHHHADAEIVVLTTAPFASFLHQAPYFDTVWIDERPGLADLAALWRLRRRLRRPGFSRVYDLQTSTRSNLYYRLLGRSPAVDGRASRRARRIRTTIPSATPCIPSTAKPTSFGVPAFSMCPRRTSAGWARTSRASASPSASWR